MAERVGLVRQHGGDPPSSSVSHLYRDEPIIVSCCEIAGDGDGYRRPMRLQLRHFRGWVARTARALLRDRALTSGEADNRDRSGDKAISGKRQQGPAVEVAGQKAHR